MESVWSPVSAEIGERLIVARAVDAVRSSHLPPVSAVLRGEDLSVLEDIIEVAVRPTIVAAPRNPDELLGWKYLPLLGGEELGPVLEQHVPSVLNGV